MAGGIREKTPQGLVPEREKAPVARILICDPIPLDPFNKLKAKGFEVDFKPKTPKEALAQIIGDYDVVVVRSATKIPGDVLLDPRNLKLIVRAGEGVDSIDVKKATELGITVANTPGANSEAAAEHTVGLIFAAARHIPQAHGRLRQGSWERENFEGEELDGKKLGIIGLGKVGSRVGEIMKNVGMKLLVYDPFITLEKANKLGVKLCSLEDLLKESDFVTVHMPLTDETRGMIGEEQLKMMKPTATIINVARGGIVDEKALFEAVSNGIIAGAAVDVFTKEPPSPDLKLLTSDNIIVTPHLGASTREAQDRVAVDAANQIAAFFNGEPVRGAVNTPKIETSILREIAPYARVAEKIARLAVLLASNRQIEGVTVDYTGKVADLDTRPLKAAIIGGLLTPISDEPVNLVNYEEAAARHGLIIREQKDPTQNSFTSVVTIRLRHQQEETRVDGVVGHDGARVVGINGYSVDFPLNGDSNLLLVSNKDIPGMVGRVASKLGESSVNIDQMSLASGKGDKALMVILMDKSLTREQVQEIQDIEGVSSAQFIKLS